MNNVHFYANIIHFCIKKHEYSIRCRCIQYLVNIEFYYQCKQMAFTDICIGKYIM